MVNEPVESFNRQIEKTISLLSDELVLLRNIERNRTRLTSVEEKMEKESRRYR